MVMSSGPGGPHPGHGAAASSSGAGPCPGLHGGPGGGPGGDHKLPSLFIERPKMPRATWEALRAHILKERERKKQEHEQSKEVERQKREREKKKKQEALSLEDTKEEIANVEAKLAALKEEKHQHFHTLKKVLYEDDRRTKEAAAFMQPSIRPNPQTHYMKTHPAHLPPPPPQQPPPPPVQQQPMAVKRPRSPSPQRGGIPASYYRQPSTNASSMGGGRHSLYTTSAVSSVSASAIYASTVPSAAHYAFAGRDEHPSVTAERIAVTQAAAAAAAAGKHIYLNAQSAAAAAAAGPPVPRSTAYGVPMSTASSSQPPPPSHQQRGLSLAVVPPSAHGAVPGFRGNSGSIMSGYPRSTSSDSLRYQPPTTAVAAPPPAQQNPRLVQLPSHVQNGSGVRYYQREV